MKKIILIQPKVGSWEFIQEVPMLPLALLQISSLLKEEYDIRIIDQRIDKDWASTLRCELKGDVLCAGITSMTGPQILYGLEASRIIRSESDVPVVWGGIHPSILPEQTVSHPDVDIVVTGEGEISFRDLAKALDSGGPIAQIPGVWTKENGKISGTQPETLSDINVLPGVPYELVDLERYIGRDREGRRKFPVQTSRGCPSRCTFCHQTSKYRKFWRSFEPGRVLEQIKFLKDRHGIEHFQILDDNFFVNIDRASTILKGLAEMKPGIVFTINGTRATDILRMDEETVKLIARAGCYELQIGLESGSQRVLDHMKKDTTISQIYRANERLKTYRIPRYYELVSGFKGETEEDLKKTAEVILELSDKDPGVFFAPLECLTPYPGTEAFKEAVDSGMKFPDSLEGWGESLWNKARLPWLSKRMKKLLEGFHIYPTLISSEIKTMRSPIVKVMFRIYRPFARFRVKKMFFRFPVESGIFNYITGLKS